MVKTTTRGNVRNCESATNTVCDYSWVLKAKIKNKKQIHDIALKSSKLFCITIFPVTENN